MINSCRRCSLHSRFVEQQWQSNLPTLHTYAFQGIVVGRKCLLQPSCLFDMRICRITACNVPLHEHLHFECLLCFMLLAGASALQFGY